MYALSARGMPCHSLVAVEFCALLVTKSNDQFQFTLSNPCGFHLSRRRGTGSLGVESALSEMDLRQGTQIVLSDFTQAVPKR